MATSGALFVLPPLPINFLWGSGANTSSRTPAGLSSFVPILEESTNRMSGSLELRFIVAE
jgi:hypothetical protein